MGDNSTRAEILGQIRNPLVFFSLALLIIEGIMGLVTANSEMSGNQQFYSLIIMASLFLIVVGVVTIITIKWPTHLYQEIAKKLETSEQVKEFINSAAFKDVIEDIVELRIEDIQKKEIKRRRSKNDRSKK